MASDPLLHRQTLVAKGITVKKERVCRSFCNDATVTHSTNGVRIFKKAVIKLRADHYEPCRMRPFFKTWLTICLFMPLAAHATNREQQLPASFSGYTAKNHLTPVIATRNAPQEATAIPQATRNARAVQTPVSRKNSAKAASAKTLAAGNAKQGNAVVKRALQTVGTPYRWGGTTPGKGLDCSGLVKYAYSDVREVDLPRTSNAMAQGHGQTVDRKDLKPGDLLFFNIKSRNVNHVAIYLGEGKFVHAPRRGKAVTVDTLNKPYWNSHYKIAKRVLPKQTNQMRVVQR
ncbi:NLP/P60-like protein-like protein [Pseudomonas viridiflava]|uniref:NLP/P60-like protein-like protein n=2 Tax=Pseudomonas viridiflava TaxID=33069 RepID=A0A3M5NXB5_PSEVI|nr:NLP/P60-like protein-like protein [Pseudomonas viridiflava]